MNTHPLRQSARSSSLSRKRNSCAWVLGSALLAGIALTAWPLQSAKACGCFSTQTVATPVVQAGEKLVFSIENGIVTMHVQIKYSGAAPDFGWILPLPTIPKDSKGMDGIEVGVDELFEQLEARTQPTYTLTTPRCQTANRFDFGGGGCSSALSSGGDFFSPTAPGEEQAPKSPLVKQDTAGPFSYAILKADNKTEMLNWLSTNGYVIPGGTDAVLAPYLRPGAFFLAVKLLSGKSAGDLQPLVIRYQADLPMIPITLTQVASTPQLGILVWVLGSARAYPRNYFHTVINEAQLDWRRNVQNYSTVVNNAIAEAKDKHAFITEYAGAADRIKAVLDTSGRFDRLNTLSAQKDPVAFVEAILPTVVPDDEFGGFPGSPVLSRVTRGLAMNGQFVSVVGSAIPMPADLAKEGVTPSDYYLNIRQYLVTDRARRPSVYRDIEAKLTAFDPMALVTDITKRIAEPTFRAGELVKKYAYLTRLYSVLAPQDMTVDPVFSFNPNLPSYSNTHSATLYTCDENSEDPLLVVTAAEGLTPWQARVNRTASVTPYSQRIEVIRDTGSPEVQVDNRAQIDAALLGTMADAQGCATQPGPARSTSPLFGLSAAAICALLLRRRRASAR